MYINFFLDGGRASKFGWGEGANLPNKSPGFKLPYLFPPFWEESEKESLVEPLYIHETFSSTLI